MNYLWELLQNPFVRVGATLLWFVIGYEIAKLSLEVYDKWDQKEDDTLGTYIGMRFFLFPLNSLIKVKGAKCQWFFVEAAREDRKEIGYLVVSMILWPLRVVWFAVIWVEFFTIAPLLSLIFAVFWRLGKDLILGISQLLQSTPRAPDKTSAAEK